MDRAARRGRAAAAGRFAARRGAAAALGWLRAAVAAVLAARERARARLRRLVLTRVRRGGEGGGK